MKKYKWWIIILNLALLLFYFNFTLFKKEEILKKGDLVLLALAPVDPRSLMQGDYMILNYHIAQLFGSDTIKNPKQGYCVVVLDSNGVANKLRFQKDLSPLKEGEYPIKYSSTEKWNMHIGAESFFFQEGHGEKYSKAKYGALKIDERGNSLLIGLYDEKWRKIN